MSVIFTKLFASITESTVWCEPDSTRIVWITMLAMADSKGRVWASIPGLANRARVTVQQVENALITFKSPDHYSRTPDNEGRRVEDIDGGWRLLNHEKYRSIRDEESIKESKRRYINERRKAEKEAEKILHVENVDRGRYNAEAEADKTKSTHLRVSNAKTNATTVTKALPLLFVEFWDAYGKKVGKPEALKEWNKISPSDDEAKEIISAANSLRLSRPDPIYRKDPERWLKKRGWEDELPTVQSVTSDPLTEIFARAI